MYELSKLILMAIFVGKTIRIQVGPDVFFLLLLFRTWIYFHKGSWIFDGETFMDIYGLMWNKYFVT